MKLNNKNKKGFTIIELVIVIAVIGILTAILVPVFINLTARANEAADDSLVKNLNTALKMEEVLLDNPKNETLQDAIDDLENEGYILENLISKSGKDLLWNQEKNEFVLNKEGEYAGKDYWQIVNEVPAYENQKYSYYAGKQFNNNVPNLKFGFDAGKNTNITSLNYIGNGIPGHEVSIRTNGGTLTVNAEKGSVKHYGQADYVDIIAVETKSYHENGTASLIKVTKGRVALENESNVGEIHLAKTGDSFDDIIIAPATNVNLPELSRDTVGTSLASDVLVCAVETENSTQYYWMSGNGTIEDSHILVSSDKEGTDKAAVETTTTDSTAIAIANAKSGEEVTDNGNFIPAAAEITPEELIENTSKGASRTFSEIDSIDKLIAFRNAWNEGKLVSGTFKLTADIDLSNIAWIPIGWGTDTLDRSFEGVFDGNGHTIKGVSNKSVDYSELSYAANASNSGTAGAIYGFFGVVGETTTIKNLTLKDVSIEFSGTSSGKGVGALIGAAYYLKSQYQYTIGASTKKYSKNMDLTIEDVHIIGGTVKAGDKVGGFIGSAAYGNMNKDSNGNNNIHNVTFTNCSIEGTRVEADASSNARVGGVLGQWGSGQTSNGTQTLTVNSLTIDCTVNAKGTGNNQAAAFAGTFNTNNSSVIVENISGVDILNTTIVTAVNGSANNAKNYFGSSNGITANTLTLPAGEANEDWVNNNQ